MKSGKPIIFLLISIVGGAVAFIGDEDWFEENSEPVKEVCFPCQHKWKAYKKDPGADTAVFSGIIQFQDYRRNRVTFTLSANSASNRKFTPAVHYSGNFDGGTFYHTSLGGDTEGTWRNLRYRRALNLITFTASYPNSKKVVSFWVKDPYR